MTPCAGRAPVDLFGFCCLLAYKPRTDRVNREARGREASDRSDRLRHGEELRCLARRGEHVDRHPVIQPAVGAEQRDAGTLQIELDRRTQITYCHAYGQDYWRYT